MTAPFRIGQEVVAVHEFPSGRAVEGARYFIGGFSERGGLLFRGVPRSDQPHGANPLYFRPVSRTTDISALVALLRDEVTV